MDREIKFRYVLEKCDGSRFYHFCTLQQIEKFGMPLLADPRNIFTVISRDLYTGFKDKSGIEIYEGDIAKTHRLMDNIVGRVQWSDREGWLIHPLDWACDSGYNLCEVRAKAEVIGNVYV